MKTALWRETLKFKAAVIALLVAILIAVVGGFRGAEQSKKNEESAKRIAEYQAEIAKIKGHQALLGCNYPKDRTPRESEACEIYQRQYADYEKLIAIQNETAWDKFVAVFGRGRK
jgi:hypothetical protein